MPSIPADPPSRSRFAPDVKGEFDARRPNLSVRAVRGIVPALPGRSTIDFDDQIEEALEEEAARIVASMSEQ